MEVKMDLAAMIRMMVTSQNDGIKQAIESYISYLENCIPAYKQILQAYRDLRAYNSDVEEDMDKAIVTF